MRYLALICDYDGTIAHHGVVAPDTKQSLVRLKRSGRRVVLVTGRVLDDLASTFDDLELFDRIVAENGALVYDPATKSGRLLGSSPPEAFVEALRARGVTPLSVGEVIVATWTPNESVVLDVIRDQGLELQVIFNKGAVMVLPAGINKAAGLAAALGDLRLSSHNVVGVGDAENDHAFLAACECSVAVANALPSLKDACDHVTEGPNGEGVRELVDRVLDDDLASLADRLRRHDLLLGETEGGDEVRIPPYGPPILVAGPSGSGKSTLVAGLLERLEEAAYQYAVIDPEGDYAGLDGAVALGDANAAPTPADVMHVLDGLGDDVVVNLLGMALAERPRFFQALFPLLQELRSRSGRPQWIVVDEAHHMVPASWEPAKETMPAEMAGLLLITVHPDHVAPAILKMVGAAIAVGEQPREVFDGIAKATGGSAPRGLPELLPPGEAIALRPGGDADPVRFRVAVARSELRRHVRKYAEGELGEDRSFYFRGPEGKLNLRAQNLATFAQTAEGVDEETWLHHLRSGDYSRWFREAIKDDELADEAAHAEQELAGSAEKSRRAILAAIERRYTAPT